MRPTVVRAMYQNVGRLGNVLYHCALSREQEPTATRYTSAELKTKIVCTMKT